MTRNQHYGISQLFDTIYPVGTLVHFVGVKGEPLIDKISSQTYMVGAVSVVDLEQAGRTECVKIVGPVNPVKS